MFKQRTPAPHRASRPAPLFVEELETRSLMSGSSLSAPLMAPLSIITPAAGGAAGVALTPAEVRHAYGFDQLQFGNGIAADGSGQVIAIVDAYDDPNIAGDLATFDQVFNLPAPLRFTKVSETGSTTALPAPDAGWSGEIALDVEWAHAVAPGAGILLVEARSDSISDLLAGVNYARSQPGVVAVSMSWGGNEFASEAQLDSYFTTPSGHIGGDGLPGGVVFVNASGDNGAPASWPAVSPNVVAVGGTTLTLDAAGNYLGETGWSGSGGGLSQFEPLPGYQGNVLAAATRGTPDVAYDADPATGFLVYDSVADRSDPGGWFDVGGTSAGTPQWAALFAIADQGRELNGLGSLDSGSGALPNLYAVAASSFHDITGGSNGLPAGPGYDLVTGRGSPTASLVGYLAATPATPDQHFLNQLYLDLLGRSVDPTGLEVWGAQLDQGVSRTQLVQEIENTDEYRARVVEGLYQSLLNRAADPGGLNFFVDFLRNGGTVEQARALIIGSPEYFQKRGGGTDQGFLTALYHDALGRSLDPTGQAVYGAQLAEGVSPGQVAAEVFGSAEYEQDLVNGLYEEFLGRQADAAGLAYFTQMLAQGWTDQQVVAALVGSDEFFSHV